jgi:CheY-like chemotaxis protein
MADHFRLEHVLINLIGNAVKFSPEGGKITLKIERDSLTTDRVGQDSRKIVTLRWSVFDEGVGIKPEFQHQLFQAYNQIDANQNQSGKGTGVGLAICKEIIELHGGRIGLRSPSPLLPPNVIRGTEFFFAIPLAVVETEGAAITPTYAGMQQALGAPAAAPAPAASTPSADANRSRSNTTSPSSPPASLVSASASQASGGGIGEASLRALVVDDVKSNRMLLSMLLRKKNIVVEDVDDGKSAVDRVASHPEGHFNVVFIDNLMPILGGLETIPILRDSRHRVNCLIIGLTGKLRVGTG